LYFNFFSGSFYDYYYYYYYYYVCGGGETRGSGRGGKFVVVGRQICGGGAAEL
jgi:hypothetical protein